MLSVSERYFTVNDASNRDIREADVVLNKTDVIRIKKYRPKDLVNFVDFYVRSDAHDIRENEFRNRLESQCGLWKDRLSSWKSSSSSEIMYAYEERSGIGDRLAGIEAALDHAILSNKQLQIDWRHISKIFTTSKFLQNPQFNYNEKFTHQSVDLKLGELPPQSNTSFTFKLTGSKYWKGRRSVNCLKNTFYSCNHKERAELGCDIYERACVDRAFCRSLVKQYKSSLSTAHTVGCPLRLAMSFKSTFFDTQITFRLNRKTIRTSISNFIELIADYKLVSIHIRSGDAVLRKEGTWKTHEVHPDNVWNASASVIPGISRESLKLAESAMRCGGIAGEGDGKEVRYIVASDNQKIRQYFEEQYGDSVILIKSVPVHISDYDQIESNKAEKVRQLEETFAEWFLIAYSDELVTNRAHSFGVSAFSRSARLFNLQPNFYLIDPYPTKDVPNFCQRRQFGYAGNLGKVASPCRIQD